MPPQPMLDAASQLRVVVLLTRMVDRLRLNSAVHECEKEVEQVLRQMWWSKPMARKRVPLLRVLAAPPLGSGLV